MSSYSILEHIMVPDLLAQVGALVGTSLLLFYVTSPDRPPLVSNQTAVAGGLHGMQQYSSYHRQRLHSLASWRQQQERAKEAAAAIRL